MSVKNPRVYGTAFCSDLTPEQCELLLQLREMDDYTPFKHLIFKFNKELIMESYERDISIRDIIKSRNIDFTQYVGELRPYQRVGAAFAYNTKHCMIGDGVGLGKTAEISAIINLNYQQKTLTRFLMAVETSAIGQTQLELMKFTGLNVVAMPSDAAKMRKFIEKMNWNLVDGIIIKHSTLKSNTFNNWIGRYVGAGGKSTLFNMFILDESSVIKGDESQTHAYTANLCRMAEKTYFMNATSFEKHILDIYYQFDMMDSMLLPEKSVINKNFCVWQRGTYWKTVTDERGMRKPKMHYKFDMVGYQNQDVFKESLKLAYIGRSRKQAGLDIPHEYKVYTVQPHPDQTQAIAAGHSYPEVLNCPSLVPGLRFDRTRCPKLDRLCTLAETELHDMKFVVYCFHVEAQYKIKEELEKIGRKCIVLNGNSHKGSDKDIRKLEDMERFNSGEYDVFITNIQKSLNLYGADAMVLYSNTATVGRLEQIRGRIDRHVDDNSRLYIMLLYEGTGEFDLINETARARGKASRSLILDAETAIDYFMAYLDAEGDE